MLWYALYVWRPNRSFRTTDSEREDSGEDQGARERLPICVVWFHMALSRRVWELQLSLLRWEGAREARASSWQSLFWRFGFQIISIEFLLISWSKDGNLKIIWHLNGACCTSCPQAWSAQGRQSQTFLAAAWDFIAQKMQRLTSKAYKAAFWK